MKCPNCGNDMTGKFCAYCGTPAPVENTQPVLEQITQPVESTPAPQQNTEPMQYNPAPQQGVEPMQSMPNTQQSVDTTPYNYEVQQPASPQQTSYGQQFTNSANNTYSGQQFSNQPQNAPKMKKGLSGGKLVAVIVSIILGLVIIFGIVIGTVACGIINATQSALDGVSSALNDEYYQSEISDIISDLESNLDEYNSDVEESSSDDDDDSEFLLDKTSHCYYKETYYGISITGFDHSYSEMSGNKADIKIPSEINGKPVLEIESFGVFDIYEKDGFYIKVTIPSSVKTIHSYAMSFCDIDEIVMEEGVEIIDEYAFIGADDLEKVTIPNSVILMDNSFIGFECDDKTYEPEKMDDFVMYGKKGSEAEAYAKENKLKFIAK